MRLEEEMEKIHQFALSNTYHRDTAWNRLMQVRGGRSEEGDCTKKRNRYGYGWFRYTYEPLNEDYKGRTSGIPRSNFDYNRDGLFWAHGRMIYFERDDYLLDLKAVHNIAYSTLMPVAPELYNQFLEKYNWYIDINNNPYELGIKRIRDECNLHWTAYGKNRTSVCTFPSPPPSSSSSSGGDSERGRDSVNGGR